MSQLHRVSLSFTLLTDGELTPVASRIIDGLTGNANFPNLPVPAPDLTTLHDNYATRLAVAKDGTKEDTLAKDLARTALENALRQDAAYVQSLANQNLQMLLSSGFEAVKTNRAQIELPKPNILRVENPQSKQIALRLDPVPTAKAYEVRVSYGPNGWQAVGVFTQARKILVADLTPRTTYTFPGARNRRQHRFQRMERSDVTHVTVSRMQRRLNQPPSCPTWLTGYGPVF